MLIGIIILLEIMIALLALGLKEKDYEKVFIVTTVVIFAMCVALAFQEDTTFTLNFMCDQGLHLMSDGFRKVYSLIIALMWMMTAFLSKDYFNHHHNLKRYYFFNLMTEAATLGVFFASDLFSAFIFFEIMSFTSFTWVIQEETDGAIRAANTYLAVAVIGGLTALMGIFMIYHALGTVTLSELYPLAAQYENHTYLFAASCCILVGFGAKAGMYPLHIWLPKAHPVAPAPSSALLSGVLTKSGIWGILAVTVNILRFDEHWGLLILFLGTITMFLGALLALFSIDLKRTLACSSMSQVGFILVAVGMMVLLGHENALAARGAILHMMNHSLFKLVLFMAAGVVYMNLHVLDLNEVRGFGKNKPFLMICFLLAAAGIAGIPSLNGYISKTLIHEAIVEGTAEFAWLKAIEWIFLISGGLTLAYMTKLFVCLFIEKPAKELKDHYMSPLSYIALGGSAILLPILGLTANKSMMGIADKTMEFFAGAELEEQLHFYSLENLKGGLISIAIGVLIYVFIVRKFMIKDGKYVNLWPSKLDLEDLIYRPVLLAIAPTVVGDLSAVVSGSLDTLIDSKLTTRILGMISHVVSDSIDAICYILRKSVFANLKYTNMDSTANKISYQMGNVIDKVRKEDDHHYARLGYRTSMSVEHAVHHLSDSLSFGLLIMVFAISIILIYVILVHHIF